MLVEGADKTIAYLFQCTIYVNLPLAHGFQFRRITAMQRFTIFWGGLYN